MSSVSLGARDGGKYIIDSRIHSMAVSTKKLSNSTSALQGIPDVRFISASTLPDDKGKSSLGKVDVARSEGIGRDDENSASYNQLDEQTENEDLISIGEFNDRPTLA